MKKLHHITKKGNPVTDMDIFIREVRKIFPNATKSMIIKTLDNGNPIFCYSYGGIHMNNHTNRDQIFKINHMARHYRKDTGFEIDTMR